MIRLTVYCIFITYVVSVNCQPLSESNPSQLNKIEEVPLWEKYDGEFMENLFRNLQNCELENDYVKSIQLRTELEELYADTLRARELDSWIPAHLKAIREFRKKKCSVPVYTVERV
ncbi:uncharacterized protein LOC130666597 [Microplitis mediator]|uniref:uncharacterized protein LOC130666597 n=1 Tax=Microplitis mediator TaxID=375433 RepID=UPI0025546657|nr:uncharacterized protein LOC130666597 [Microplitis mediator]